MPKPIPPSSDAIRANAFMFFPEFTVCVLRAIQDGHTVTRFLIDQPEKQLHMEFEVCVKRINGEAVPRITKSMATNARKVTK